VYSNEYYASTLIPASLLATPRLVNVIIRNSIIYPCLGSESNTSLPAIFVILP
jgi:hypothetical protein